MIDHDRMLGIQKTDHRELKEVKVKLPVQHLLKLHYMKLTSSRTFSNVITQALNDYFEAMRGDELGTSSDDETN